VTFGRVWRTAVLALAGIGILAGGLGWADEPPGPVSEVVLGVPTSLTLLEGRESLDAVRLAAEEINAAGGVRLTDGPRPIRVESVDLEDALPGVTPDLALARLDRFVSEKKVDGLVVGPFRSEVLLAALDHVAQYRRPLLGTIAMSSAIEKSILRRPEYRYVFRLGLDAGYLVEYLVEGMKLVKSRFGYDRVYILNQDVAWARSTASMMIRLHLVRHGWTVLGQTSLSGQEDDYSGQLDEADRLGAQVILCVFDSPQSGRLVEQWNTRRSPALLTGFISPTCGPDAWPRFQGRISGAINAIFELGNIPSDQYPPSQAFYERFQARFGRPIQAGHGPAPSYEAVHVFAEAAARAGSVDPERMVMELERTDRRGAMGRIRFHRGHQAVFGRDPEEEALACLIQWTRDGRRRIVYPPRLAQGGIEPPAWARDGVDWGER
jgi:branched-chain amino acid transport system substrate-binding protein